MKKYFVNLNEDCDISGAMRNMRTSAGLSVDELTKKLQDRGFKISAKTIYGYENGVSMPNADLFLEMCKICHTEVLIKARDSMILSNDELQLVDLYRKTDDGWKIKTLERLQTYYDLLTSGRIKNER